MRSRGKLLLLAVAAITMATPSIASSAPPVPTPNISLLVSGLAGGSGSTLGPDGALYVTESEVGRISRVDPTTGTTTTFAEGLPPRVIPLGGAMDVAFMGETAYALVTLVGPDIGGTEVVGIYRVDGPDSFTVVADIGAFAVANPPATPFDVPTGVQYSLEVFHGAFLVADGHHNRVLRVTLDGEVTEVIQFDNIVPTGLEVRGSTVFMAQAGPVPHLPEDGKLVSFKPGSPTPTELASGGRLLVDVEFGRGRSLYALAQGVFPEGNPPGSPALPDTGQLLRANSDSTFTVVADKLNQPTSLEFIKDTAYVVTLTGEIWTVAND